MSRNSPGKELLTPMEQASAWCLRLSEGALDAEEARAFDAWLAEDPDHGLALDDAVRAWRAIDSAAAEPEMIEMRTAALIGYQRDQKRRWTREPVIRWRLALAAVATLAFLITGAWLQNRPLVYQTGDGERRIVVLNDGSRLSLDSATRVEVTYRNDSRALSLRFGRAKFKVAKDVDRPFTVAAADKVVRATGTEFSVELLRDQVRVVLLQGHVRVSERASSEFSSRRLNLGRPDTLADSALLPNRELIATVGALSANVVPVDPEQAVAWEAGQLSFVDEPLAAAVEQVNRYADDKISVGDAEAGKIPISGNFRAGDTAAFISGVTGVFPVRAVDQNGRTSLISR